MKSLLTYWQRERAVAALGVAAVLSALALLGAYTAEYGFGLKPCVLCLYQRVPYAVVMAAGGLGLLLRRNKGVVRILLGLALLAVLINAGIAGYHTGVEKGIFQGPTGCSGGGVDPSMSIEELREQLMGASIVPCNQPAWEWHGITMALLNVPYALMVAVVALLGLMGGPTNPRTKD